MDDVSQISKKSDKQVRCLALAAIGWIGYRANKETGTPIAGQSATGNVSIDCRLGMATG